MPKTKDGSAPPDAPPGNSGGNGDRPLNITFTGQTARAARRLASQHQLTPPAVFRRGLALYDIWSQFTPDEEFIIHNRRTGSMERVVAWEENDETSREFWEMVESNKHGPLRSVWRRLRGH